MKYQRSTAFGLGLLAMMVSLATASSAWAAASIVSARNSSDPRARVFDGKLYLFTSSDMNQAGNWPMNKTYCYSLTDSSADPGVADNWTDHGAVLEESAYAWSAKQNHLWAPDAFVGKDGQYYLYVPDTFDSTGGSRIGVSVSSAPTGPFAPPTGMTSSTNYLPTVTPYMSDPSVFEDPNDPSGQRYLVYADGDYNSGSFGCGHLSIAKVDPATSKLTGNQKIQFSNQSAMPSAGGCTPAYIEGAELAYFGGPGTDGDGKYFLYFAIKDNTGYTESIAYATADTVLGPYTYQGAIMSGQGGIGWTNQASIVEWQGHYLFFYHNDPKNQSNPNRQVFLECVGIEAGKIKPVTRGSYTTLAACPKAKTGMSGTSGAADGGSSGQSGRDAGAGDATVSGRSGASGGHSGSSSGDDVGASGGSGRSGASGGLRDSGVSGAAGRTGASGGTGSATGTTGGSGRTGGSGSSGGSGLAEGVGDSGEDLGNTSTKSGCACHLPGTADTRTGVPLGVLGLAMAAWARRRRRS